MFGLWGASKKSNPIISENDRYWMDEHLRTVSVVKMYFSEAREVFVYFCGAVFALHQDTLRAYAVDMSRTEDLVRGVDLQKLWPNNLGYFSRRVQLTKEAMCHITDPASAVPSDLDQADQNTSIMVACMRVTAARVWLLTMEAKTNALFIPSSMTIWTMLQMVSPVDLLPGAREFSGLFYNNVRSDTMDTSDWEMAKAQALSCAS